MQDVQLKEVERISQKCNAKPNDCSCEQCRQMCKHAPCIGTPKEILDLIENGLGDYLEANIFLAGWPLGFLHPPINMVISKTQEDGSCVFFNNGGCLLHNVGLKPTEGRLASCKDGPQYFAGSSCWATAQEWLLTENQEIVDKVLKSMEP